MSIAEVNVNVQIVSLGVCMCVRACVCERESVYIDSFTFGQGYFIFRIWGGGVAVVG